jgi:hypothetical protein
VLIVRCCPRQTARKQSLSAVKCMIEMGTSQGGGTEEIALEEALLNAK